MTTHSDKRVGAAVERGLYLWKVLQAILGLCAVVWALWASTLGPGVRDALQSFLGISAIIERLEFVEVNMPPPRVVDWDETRTAQQGVCNSDRCVYVMTGSRTTFGEQCGRPVETTPFLRTENGQTIQVAYHSSFRPVELGRSPTSFQAPLVVPSFVPPGVHMWRAKVIYPSCPGFLEPIPRWTPWFPLRVTKVQRGK